MNLKTFIVNDLIQKGLTDLQAEEAFAYARPKVDDFFTTYAIDSKIKYDWESELLETHIVLRYVFIGVFDGFVLEWIDLNCPDADFRSEFDQDELSNHYDIIAERIEIDCIRAAKKGLLCHWVRNADTIPERVKDKLIQKNYTITEFFGLEGEKVWCIQFS